MATAVLNSLRLPRPSDLTSAPIPTRRRTSPPLRRRTSLPLRRRHRGAAAAAVAVVNQQYLQGASANYAKEMERLSAKESLLLAFKDAGGFEALTGGRTTEMQRIDVNERIVALERLNPTLRPTTSPFLDGRWNFEWIGAGSPGLFAARFLFERSPAGLANLLALNLLIKDNYSKVTATLKFLNSVETKFHLTTKLSVEGPTRFKEEYDEGILETPVVSEESIPEQIKGILGQATGTLQQLPPQIRDGFANGLKLPLSGIYQRLLMISYLDEEILIIRDSAGAPDVLTRLEGPPEILSSEPIMPEYES